MRMLLVILAAVAAVAGVVALRSGGEEPTRYRVVLDNAFGLTEGADFRAGGVRVGQVKSLDVEPRTARAVVTVEVQDTSFGSLRRDATCSVEPQSLIGEYFLDCQPGTARAALPDGGTVPVERTEGTVPPDLVQEIMRRPYRERFGILIAELGAGFAARGGDLNVAIRRAVPALRETDRVLKLLAGERRTLQRLIVDADVVLGRLADGRRDVSRFVKEAGETAQASAERREDLRTTFAELPEFLRGLRPTLADLGTVARRQTPALRDLAAAAPDLTRLFERLGPFSRASLPAITSLGEASRTGRSAVRRARSTVRELRKLGGKTREPLTNLRFTLEHLDDRSFAVEPSPGSPGEKGFTGLEALLQYPFMQAQAINIFDARGYYLKLNALSNECSQYTNADSAREDPERTKRCSAALGPNGPLGDTPEQRTQRERSARKPERQAPAQAPAPAAPEPAPSAQDDKPAKQPSLLPDEIRLPGLPPIKIPPLELPRAGGGDREGRDPSVDGGRLLDYLLGA